MKRKNGFTLIELLAVILIIGIIALITTPLVLDTINESKKATKLVSASNYLKAAQNSIKVSNLNGKYVDSGIYEITPEGNICLGVNNPTGCIGDLLELDIDGEIPNKGYVVVEEEEIKEIDIYFDDILVKKPRDHDFFYPEYELGEEISFDPGDGVNTTWNVVGETKDKVILMLNKNTIAAVVWTRSDSYSEANTDGTYCEIIDEQTNQAVCADEGPLYALYALNGDDTKNVISTWTNVDPIEKYSFINSNEMSYKELKINNGITTIIDDNGNRNILPYETKARLITMEEIVKLLINEKPYTVNYFSDLIIENYFSSYLKSPDVLSAGIQSWDELRSYVFKEDKGVELPEQLSLNEQLFSNYYLVDNLMEPEEKIIIPNWLFHNLEENSSTLGPGYFLLNSFTNNLAISFNKVYNAFGASISDFQGVRPVIEVSKEKLK